MGNVNVRAAKKIQTGRHYVFPEEFSLIIRANITPEYSAIESTKFTLNTTIVDLVGWSLPPQKNCPGSNSHHCHRHNSRGIAHWKRYFFHIDASSHFAEGKRYSCKKTTRNIDQSFHWESISSINANTNSTTSVRITRTKQRVAFSKKRTATVFVSHCPCDDTGVRGVWHRPLYHFRNCHSCDENP